MNTRCIILVWLITAVIAICASASAFATTEKLICSGTRRDYQGNVTTTGNWVFVIDDSDKSVTSPYIPAGVQTTVSVYNESLIRFTVSFPNYPTDFMIDRVTGDFLLMRHGRGEENYAGACTKAKQKF